MNILVDAFGGDNAPLEIIKGSRLAMEEFGVNITLVGNKDKLDKCFEDNNISKDGFKFINAQTEVTMETHPEDIRKMKDSSMAVALSALNNGEGDAVISAGNTGALVVGATLFAKRIKGVKRAALAPVLPTNGGDKVLLIDAGANAECKPSMLLHFAVMGSEYMSSVYGVDSPRVGLLNVGTEDTKGGQIQLETFALLKESGLNFVGNVEARDVLFGVCDVLVTDGFSGNILLKSCEGLALLFFDNLKQIFYKNLATKCAAAVVKDGLRGFKHKMDYTENGGAPLLGISKPVIKAHGNSTAKAFKNGIKQAIDFANSKMIDRIKETIKEDIDE